MTVQANPYIASSGLVLCLDAYNARSWPGSGTIWYDASGQNNTASMYGTVPTSSDGGACFDFATVTGSGAAPASAASLGFTFVNNMVPTTGSFTLSAWVKNMPSTNLQVTLLSNAGGGDGYRWGPRLASTYVLTGPTYLETGLSYSSTLSSSLWYLITTVFDRSGTNSGGTPQWQQYVNADFQTSVNMAASQTAAPGTAPGIVRNPCCDLYTGKLAILMIYNRALSASEITQNFNAYRGRFGV